MNKLKLGLSLLVGVPMIMLGLDLSARLGYSVIGAYAAILGGLIVVWGLVQ